MTLKIALIGDYSEAVIAHRAIPKALKLESEALGWPPLLFGDRIST